MPAPTISRPTLLFFRLITSTWFQLHFTSVLTLDTAPFRTADPHAPLIIYGNHSSWWDPLIAVLLAAKLAPRRPHFAPMDAAALAGNRLLGRIGIFPVDLTSALGARQFLHAGKAIAQQNGVLWVTPQGRFADTREEPLRFRPGLAALLARTPGATVLPLATEYTFWNTRLPHAFAHFGPPVQLTGPASTHTAQLEQALTQTMQELQTEVLTRTPTPFTPVPLWRRLPPP